MRIALVIPWFGPDLKGGAEQQAWQLATRFAARGHEVEVLTTLCRSFLEDWAVNHLAAEDERIEGVRVRRFAVESRDRPAFDALNIRLLGIPRESLCPGVAPVPAEEARIWTDHNINSRALEAYLRENAAGYDVFLFIPYLYGPTLRGLPLVAERAWMQPCLHDECYAYLPEVAAAVYAARGLLFNSAGERELARRLYGPAAWAKGTITGEGIEFEPLRAHQEAPLPPRLAGRRFVLFLGRRDAGKGVDLLVEAFRRMRREVGASDLTLVLAGPGASDYAVPDDGILDLGLVGDDVRVALLREAAALMLPSPNESFSRVLHEAWYMGKPAVVRRACEATKIAVEESGGGWIAETAAEWAGVLAKIARGDLDDRALSAAGALGRSHALEHADWDRVMERYERLFEEFLSGDDAKDLRNAGLVRDPSRHPAAIHQLSPNLSYGDAISNEMLGLRKMLRAAGFRSEIIVRHVERGLLNEVKLFDPEALEPGDGLIYHHSIGSEVTPAAVAHAGPKGLVYHNITPGEYFRPYRPEFAPLLRNGREDLWALAHAFPVSAGDSAYNARELERFGFEDPQVLPLFVDPLEWSAPPSPGWMAALGDGRPNVLFVGRVAPNKRQDRLVRAFALLRKMINARLVIAGSTPAGDLFSDHVRGLVREHGLENDVVISGHCSQADVHAFFRTARAFWSFSEHEGFCVPVVEAMWFDVPVVALSSSAVRETLGDAGITFPWLEEDATVAGLVHRVLTQEDLRSRIIAGQRRRRTDFGRLQSAASLARLIERVVARHQRHATPAHA